MPYIKDTFSILSECAAIDLQDTHRIVRESEVRSAYNNIEEASSEYEVMPEMIPVVEMDGAYYTEANFLAPLMRDTGIKSMTEALDLVAKANHLQSKTVGLLIESECAVSQMIEKACQKENGKIKDAVMNKVDKAANLAKSLKDKGYPVRRKKNKKKDV